MQNSNPIGSKRTRWLFTILLTLTLSGWGVATAVAQERTDFKVGLAALVNTALPLYLAEAGGFYAQQGLRVVISDMGGGSRGAQALETNEIQVMHVGLSGVVSRNIKGGDLRVIASLSNVMRFTFFSDPKVRKAADLKGGIVGVSSFGSESDSAATLALQKLGLSRADVTLKEVGGSPQRLAAIKSGAIRAAAMNEPAATQALEQDLFPMVDLFAEQIPWLFTGLTVDKRYLDGHRELLTRFLTATLAGSYRGLADEKWAKEVLAREFKLSDPRIIDIAYIDFKAQMPEHAMPTRAAAENVLAQLQSFGIKLKSQKVEDYVDTSLIDALVKDGTLTGLQKKYGKP
jgi:NitT/TauT family transport system substrate-binding protein